MSLLFLLYNMMLVIPAYFKGFLGVNHLFMLNKPVVNMLIWFFGGFFILLWLAFRDTWSVF